MTGGSKVIAPIPIMLSTDTNDDCSVASELTDPLAAWSDWNPCTSDNGKKRSTTNSDDDTESETESEYETESSFNSSSDGYDSDEDYSREQPSSRRKKMKQVAPLDSRRTKTDSFDPVQAFVDFFTWMLDFDSDEETECCAPSHSLLPADMAVMVKDTGLSDDNAGGKRGIRKPEPLVRQRANLPTKDMHDESELDLRSQDSETYYDHVVVSTEAIVFSDFQADSANSPLVMRNNLVGTVHHVGPDAKELGLRQGMRVASIAKCDHNSKFVSLPVDHLYIVPKSLDSAEVAALFSFYLPAFQALHHGRSRPYRYSKSCLKGKKILVTGGNRLEAQALLRLARLGGATELYVTAPLEYHPTLGKIEGVHLLEDFPKGGWLPTVRGQMDLVIDYEFPKSFKSVRKSLTKKGRLVCIPAKKSPLASSIYEQYRIASMKRASLFDFNHCFENALEDMHKDVKFLLRQLAKRQVRPSIDRFVKLSDLPRLCDTVQGCALSGAVVCEPRKE